MIRAAAVLLLFVGSAEAAIYKCAVGGKTVFQDQPCAGAPAEQSRIEDPAIRQPLTGDVEATVDNSDLLRQSNIRTAIEKGQVMVGMNKEQAKRSWGSPTKVNRSFGGGVAREQWVYDRGRSSAQYLYFQGDALTSWN